MTSGGPDLEGLRFFSEPSDRESAPFFVGRAGEIEDIERALARAVRHAQAGQRSAGATRLIQGAPGAGKSALLAHLEEKWTQASPRAPHVLLVYLGELADPDRIAQAIAARLDPRRAERFRRTETRSGSIGISGVGGAWAAETAPPAGFGALREMFPPERWEHPLCLLVDEVQNLDSSQAEVLQRLHEAVDGLPVAPVLAGLANARDVLAKHGISRLSDGAVHMLGRLEPGQPAESVRAMLKGFRVEAAEAEAARWAALLEDRSDRWPQHLRNGMRALAEGLLASGGALASVDENAVLAGAEERRLDSYRARRSPEMLSSGLLLAAVMNAVPEEGLGYIEMLRVIEDSAGAASGWRLPAGMRPEGYLDHLVHRGALQDDGTGRLACPIPSFRQFLVEAGS